MRSPMGIRLTAVLGALTVLAAMVAVKPPVLADSEFDVFPPTDPPPAETVDPFGASPIDQSALTNGRSDSTVSCHHSVGDARWAEPGTLHGHTPVQHADSQSEQRRRGGRGQADHHQFRRPNHRPAASRRRDTHLVESACAGQVLLDERQAGALAAI